MSVKKSSVSMPMTQAGILGITSDTELGGIKFDPKTVVIGIVLFIVLVKIASMLIPLA
ncbi:preprotein translocase subunit Sec61beta [Candidatus Micrarchaeota archaeon]|nr:preprotein translocase subunit Sec61beta [Candidatus Micrarchaeota archaeon]